ncbi:hypothetical protein A2625_06660 [candidate division WOR-1 bacterium RIFCSPHIGHO2_01_FULL_53_15]|uniref:HEPN domain-containing protein n=1 Tax=candidate division WOR-1 bacterium RIFCSPHIGHO2_01_FULL_53_15 TaxID=1802564 RepID=A0A1F4Q4Z4_UNCSA|nr:MAG: hypothetical protein A2625_06660 [candidate division WOR-1 bacterium RIFCSPHIGHO2_01_FULL_53_15]OGC10285.1 MAG: hypothetical protein A3D23_06665 [candidate division WOR-1 bacterium RIFCSPHIGHO2_02_FULL_53_26]
MSFIDLENSALIEKIKPDAVQIGRFLSRSLKDLKTAKANLNIDEEWAYAIAYHAMLRAGRALLLAEGYRSKGKDQHKTIILAAKESLGEKFGLLLNNFDRMRRKRHEFIYESFKPIPFSEAETALTTAAELVKKVIDIVQTKSPQTRLFK